MQPEQKLDRLQPERLLIWSEREDLKGKVLRLHRSCPERMGWCHEAFWLAG